MPMTKRQRELRDILFSKSGYAERDNSLAELHRIYVYLIGSNRGYSKLADRIKSDQEKNIIRVGECRQWYFDTDRVFQILMEEDELANIIKFRRIDSYAELSERAFNF